MRCEIKRGNNYRPQWFFHCSMSRAYSGGSYKSKYYIKSNQLTWISEQLWKNDTCLLNTTDGGLHCNIFCNSFPLTSNSADAIFVSRPRIELPTFLIVDRIMRFREIICSNPKDINTGVTWRTRFLISAQARIRQTRQRGSHHSYYGTLVSILVPFSTATITNITTIIISVFLKNRIL